MRFSVDAVRLYLLIRVTCVYVSMRICVTFRCVCPEGFEGDECEINIDDCEDNDCENNSTCVDGINNYTCMCSPEYSGTPHRHSLVQAHFTGIAVESVSKQKHRTILEVLAMADLLRKV